VFVVRPVDVRMLKTALHAIALIVGECSENGGCEGSLDVFVAHFRAHQIGCMSLPQFVPTTTTRLVASDGDDSALFFLACCRDLP
jgi:hypothetical protein